MMVILYTHTYVFRFQKIPEALYVDVASWLKQKIG